MSSEGEGPGESTDRSGVAESDELVYVSWGGTGRAATLRAALARAAAASQGLVYVAILDDSAFGDVDRTMIELAKDELDWLLRAQLEMAGKETGFEHVPTRVLVRAGDVAAEVIEAVQAVGRAEVVIGAPVPVGQERAVAELVEHLSARLTAPVSLLTR
jgi:hypothetical protein